MCVYIYIYPPTHTHYICIYIYVYIIYICVCVCIYIMEYYSATRKRKDTLPFTVTEVELESVVLNETNQRQILYVITYMWNIKKKKPHKR